MRGAPNGRIAFLILSGLAPEQDPAVLAWRDRIGVRSEPVLYPWWTREEGIAWLVWNDRDGVWTDADCIAECPGRPLTHAEVARYILDMTAEGHGPYSDIRTRRVYCDGAA